MLRTLAKGLSFLWTVDGVEPDAFGVAVVQDFDGVAVEDGDDGPGKVFCERGLGEKDVQHSDPDDRLAPHASGLVTPWRVACSRRVSRTAASETRRILYLAPSPYLRRDDLSSVGITSPGVDLYNVSCTGLGMPVRT